MLLPLPVARRKHLKVAPQRRLCQALQHPGDGSSNAIYDGASGDDAAGVAYAGVPPGGGTFAPSAPQRVPPPSPRFHFPLGPAGRMVTFKEARTYLGIRMHGYQPDEPVSREDEELLLELLRFHPNGQEKLGGDLLGAQLSHMTVQVTQQGTKCFWIHRRDGTTTDFRCAPRAGSAMPPCLQTGSHASAVKVAALLESGGRGTARVLLSHRGSPLVPLGRSYIKCLLNAAYMHRHGLVDGLGWPTSPPPPFSIHSQQLLQQQQPPQQQQQHADGNGAYASPHEQWPQANGHGSQQQQSGYLPPQQAWDLGRRAHRGGTWDGGARLGAPPPPPSPRASPWQDCLRALRNVAVPQLRRFQQRALESADHRGHGCTCTLTGDALTLGNSVVRYHPPQTLRTLAAAWLRSEGLTHPSQVPVGPASEAAAPSGGKGPAEEWAAGAGPAGDMLTLLDEAQRQSWWDYHKSNAQVQLVSRRAVVPAGTPPPQQQQWR